ncbi:unnamed protein product [Phaeothamnion confervicola]
MQLAITPPNARALARILAVVPRWTAVCPAGEAIGLPDRVLLHAGPPLPDPKSPPPPMLNAAVLSCLYEGWAKDEAEAERLVASGAVRLEPSFTRRVSTPLVSMVSARTTVAAIEDAASGAKWFSFLGTGGGAQMRFGARDRAILDKLAFREKELAPGFAELLSEPLDLLSIARSALTEGDDLHNRLSSGTAVMQAALGTRKVESPAAQAALRTLTEAPLFFLNFWMPACALMLDAAAGEEGSSIVTRLCANGQITGIQVAGLPGRWFTAPAAPVAGPFMKGLTIPDPQFPPATGDSGIIDAFGLGGQVLRRAPTLQVAFEPWLAKDDDARALSMVCAMHPVLGVEVGLDAAAVARGGKSPLLSTGMVDPLGRGLLGRGLCAMPVALFEEAVRALG